MISHHIQQFLGSVLSDISYFDNIAQFIVLVGSLLVLLFVFTLPYRSPIKAVLKDLGIPWLLTYRMVWRCRKNPRVHIRLFIEMSILRSRGVRRDTAWWSELAGEFVTWLDQGGPSDDHPILMESCFELTSSELAAKIGDYLNFLKEPGPRKFFGSRRGAPVSFLSSVHIEDGYLAPLTFITGLQDRFNEDWKQIIAKYAQAFRSGNNGSTIPSELYQSYAWLMWGPSYQLNYGEDDYKLIQYGFGDESNSIRIVLPNDGAGREVWKRLNRQHLDPAHRQTFGLHCPLTAKIFDASTYFRQHSGLFPDAAGAFVERLSRPATGANFIFEFERTPPLQHSSRREYFFSAYLWLMFTVNTDDATQFNPQHAVIFFEHANLAEPGNYDFLLSCLIAKAFRHFTDVFANPGLDGRSYSYCLAMNNDIADRFQAALHQHRSQSDSALSLAYQTRLSERARYSLDEVLDAFDTYFADANAPVVYTDVRMDDPSSIRMLCEFYAHLYLPVFPDPNERESLDNILAYLSQKRAGGYGQNNYHVVLVVNAEQQVVGGAVCDYLRGPNCGVIEFLAVREDCRLNGHGAALYAHVLTKLKSDARRAGEQSLGFVLAEMEDPRLGDDSERETKAGRIRFWSKLGFAALDFAYIQPALAPDKEPVRSLMLACRAYETAHIPAAVLVTALKEYARLAMRIEHPESNPEIQAMIADIGGRNVVTSSPLRDLVG